MKHTAKKCILLLAGLALAAVLSGCTFFDSSVEQLFTLPRMAEEYTGLSQQIDSLIDQGYEYASPSGGRNIQSVQMVDLEDDGIQEALVFLRRSSDEKPLKIMVFRLEGDTYRCFCTIESSGSAVDMSRLWASCRAVKSEPSGIPQPRMYWAARAVKPATWGAAMEVPDIFS